MFKMFRSNFSFALSFRTICYFFLFVFFFFCIFVYMTFTSSFVLTVF